MAIGALYLLVIVLWDGMTIGNLEDVRAQGGFLHYEFNQLLSPDERKCSASECIGQLFFTFPTVASIAYSCGAWLALR